MKTRTTAAIALLMSGLTVSACGGGHQQQPASNGDVSTPAAASAPAAAPAPVADTVVRQPHHSKLAGAAVGAVVGHELGGHAAAGAAVGALVQHHRNKRTP
jgi:hypothetical protein